MIKYRILRNIMPNIFEHEEEDYYKPLRLSSFWSNNYIEYESKIDRKTLSVKEYLNKIWPYLKDIINNLNNSCTWKIQVTITINCISSKDNYDDEEHVMNSKHDNKEIMINEKADEIVNEIFELLLNRY